MRYPEFRTSGIPNPMSSASATTASTMVTNPEDAGKKIIVYDIMASAATSLKTGGGTVIIHVPAGSTNLTAGISFGDGNDVVLDTSVNCTITYAIVDI